MHQPCAGGTRGLNASASLTSPCERRRAARGFEGIESPACVRSQAGFRRIEQTSHSGVAQRQSGWLLTTRSWVRIPPPELSRERCGRPFGLKRVCRVCGAAAGWVAQLVEHRTENPGVGGSSPPPAMGRIGMCRIGAAIGTRLVRPVAQLAEHRSPKPGVGGSSPSGPVGSRSSVAERFLGKEEVAGSIPAASLAGSAPVARVDRAAAF